MDVDDMLRAARLPEVAVGTEDALAATVRRGRAHRRRRRNAVVGAGCALAVAGVGAVAGGLALAGPDDTTKVLAGPDDPTASTDPTDPAGPGAAATRACPADDGAATDVAHEPDWRQYADYTDWTDLAGCLVRIDVLAERPGPDHCGFERATVLITGRPFGARYTTSTDDVEYVRDPEGVFGDPQLRAGFDPDATLPATAVDSGFRRDGVALWHDPADASAVWLVGPDHTERWPAGEPPLCM